jgi:hypothetical protein
MLLNCLINFDGALDGAIAYHPLYRDSTISRIATDKA